MISCFYCYSLLSSIFLTSHIRSFCISFLLLSILFTFINFLTTTTSINKLTTNEYKNDQNSTITISSYPLLLLNFEDVYHDKFNCYGRIYTQRLNRKKINNKTLIIPIELNQPNKTLFEQNIISYDYNNWQSTSLMPRLVTKCEHNLMMQLLKRFDQLTKKYSLEYMMIDGTLLGSWRHHDLIPWDDDIDLLMSVQFKHRLNMAIKLESSSLSPYYIEFHHRWDSPKEFEYYKFYFSISPRFSQYPWHYPFVDLIFYHENQTHIWQENMQHISSISKQYIFPLQYRPLGSLWLPAPKSPHDYFMSVNWTTYDYECFNGPWSHKYERIKDIDYSNELKSTIDCKELHEFYPFVERSLTNEEERLVINGTVKHIIKMIKDKYE
ncbi:unnamed protein product [Rotaria sordida]|uniref:LicD/FKTN/FKRP nucleotidyltransferase domain-containing protein n=1 Tax=Rotaria sordida TaxID=392033 RepID=A0A819A248_9BILA|nr:unnamed protein product [Rotaria sordida]CAF0987624.1 unnamed protein product [Rotaria sordida]CAF1014254.1 unnamed protein product [Rotaria sordida]CAF1121185.1 unnamed protein product [Rotaria sordida]CAF3771459.1 unnamed protein product [Rotaria sordida]